MWHSVSLPPRPGALSLNDATLAALVKRTRCAVFRLALWGHTEVTRHGLADTLLRVSAPRLASFIVHLPQGENTYDWTERELCEALCGQGDVGECVRLLSTSHSESQAATSAALALSWCCKDTEMRVAAVASGAVEATARALTVHPNRRLRGASRRARARAAATRPPPRPKRKRRRRRRRTQRRRRLTTRATGRR